MPQTQTSYLVIDHVTKRFGDLIALNDVSLDVHEGEFICLLGPSGCGKTTLLRIIAGLEQQNAGRVFQAGQDISRLPPRERDFGIVFQSYALFPNLTAHENIAYGLKNRKLPKAQIEARVKELLDLVGLPEVGHKYPSQLSGGQQQRIALARALATSPGLLLLDEPLSALDARVRVSLRLEIKHLQQRLGVTTVFVTHDQEEALVMADRIVVMQQGKIEQIGEPEEIYRSPATPFVADFVGTMNFLACQTSSNPQQITYGGLTLSCPTPINLGAEKPVTVAIRPEDIRLEKSSSGKQNMFHARVEEAEFLGSFYRLTLSLEAENGQAVVAEVSNNRMRELELEKGSQIAIQFPLEMMRVYPMVVGAKS